MRSDPCCARFIGCVLPLVVNNRYGESMSKGDKLTANNGDNRNGSNTKLVNKSEFKRILSKKKRKEAIELQISRKLSDWSFTEIT